MSEAKNNWVNLGIGTIGIYSIYCLGAILQEYIMSQPYVNWETDEEDNMNFSNAFIITPSLVSWGLGAFLNRKNKTKTYIPQRNLIICALLVFVTTLAFTKAIYLTSFPIVMMFKSCNILSIISVSVFCSRVVQKTQRLKKKQMMTGIFVTFGLLFFYLGGTNQQKQRSMTISGLVLLIISLLCDGFLPDFQAQIKASYKPTPLEMFQQTNKWKTIIALLYSIVTFELFDLLKYLFYHPVCFVHLIILSLMGAAGQMVIFWMISLYRQHIVPFIITTRKIFTTLLSILFFNHSSTIWQFIGIFVTFGIAVYDFKNQISHQQKIQLKQKNSNLQQQSQILSLLQQEIEMQNEQQRKLQQKVLKPVIPLSHISQVQWRQKYDLLELMEQIYPSQDLIQKLQRQQVQINSRQLAQQATSVKSNQDTLTTQSKE